MIAGRGVSSVSARRLAVIVAESEMHTHMSSSYSCLLVCVWVFFRFKIAICMFLLSSSCVVWFYYASLVYSILSQAIGWLERLRNDLYCVDWDVKP